MHIWEVKSACPLLSVRLRMLSLALISNFIVLFLPLTLVNIPSLFAQTATTWYVDDSVATSGNGQSQATAFKTIAEALLQSKAGDLVSVAAGQYAGGFQIPTSVTLQGSGYQRSMITGGGSTDQVVIMAANSQVKGFTISDSGPDYWDAGVLAIGSGVKILQNRMTNNSNGIILGDCSAGCEAANLVERNILDKNRVKGLSGGTNAIAYVRNNTVANNTTYGLVVNAAGSVVENNIILNHQDRGLWLADTVNQRYNNVFNPGLVAPEIYTHEGSLVAEPLLRNLVNGDYRLSAGSPMRGRSASKTEDLGALSFNGVGDTPLDLHVAQVSLSAWQITWVSAAQANAAPSKSYLYLGVQPNWFDKQIDLDNATSYTLRDLPGNLTYYVAVSHVDDQGQESELSDVISFTTPAVTLPVGTAQTDISGIYQETSDALLWRGAWQSRSDNAALSGSLTEGSQPGDSVELSFRGDNIVLYRTLGPDGGNARIYLDNHYFDTMGFYFSEVRAQIPAVFDNLGEGIHRLRIVIDDNKHPASTGYRVTIDAFGNPSAYVPSEFQKQAFEAVNNYRRKVGIPLLRSSGPLNLAAQFHADYDVNTNKIYGHREEPNTPGYFGVRGGDRATYFGYNPYVGENMHSIGRPRLAVEDWMASIYHRSLILDYHMQEMGYGGAVKEQNRTDVLDLGGRRVLHKGVETRLLYSYPAPGAADVPARWHGMEIPDPLPNLPQNGRAVGYPISLYLVQPDPVTVEASSPMTDKQGQKSEKWQLTLAELRDAQGNVVPVYVLDQNSDERLTSDVAFIIPQKPMSVSALYKAHFAGTDSQGVAFDYEFPFFTGVVVEATPIPDSFTVRVFLPTAKR